MNLRISNLNKEAIFIFTNCQYTSVPKYTAKERIELSNIVASLTIKRIPDPMIIKHVENTTGRTISRMTVWNIRQRLKKDSYDWYSKLRQGEYEYIHEFKERVNEIADLQRRHYKIIEENQDNPSIQQTSLAELHRLNITLSNYFDVAPSIGNSSLPEPSKTEKRTDQRDIIV